MRFPETLRIVFINIIQNKFKVLLTSLGIIVGAVTIVLVIAIGQGGEDEVMAQFSGLNAETIYVNPDYSKSSFNNIESIPKLTVDIMNQIMDESTTLSAIDIRGNAYKESVINGTKEQVAIAGVTEEYSKVSNLDVVYGENISDIDVEDYTNVAVIGDGLAKKYFMKQEDAIGSTIKINNRTYIIKGVLGRRGDGMQGLSPDETIFIPFTTASQYVFDNNTMPQIVALASKLSLVKRAMAEIKDTINYVLEDGSVYKLEDTGSRIEAATKSAKTMKLLLMSVATIVFIVGGIGIMNVLFVSVKERTKEIGILKALGSSKKDIMIQFILESVIISVFGGVVGILLSVYIMPLMKYTNIPVTPSVSGKVMALIFAVVTGTLFGIYPAYKAANLKPIEALSYE